MMTTKSILLAVFALATISCGHKSDNQKTQKNFNPESIAPASFLVQGTEAKVFQDVSSELRCDGLKDFFTQFALKALDSGKLENFSCKDMSLDTRDNYIVVLQLRSGDRTAAIQINIAGSSASTPSYCPLPFEIAVSDVCSSDWKYYDVAEPSNAKTGLIHPNMEVLRDFVSQYVSQPQSKDLAYGIDVKDFALAWTNKLNAGEKWVSSGPNKFEIALVLQPAQEGILSGTLKISDINSEAIDKQIILGCQTKECLTSGIFKYSFNGHHLVVHSDGWYLSIPLLPTN